MSSLGGETLLQLGLGRTFKLNSLRNLRGGVLKGICNRNGLVSVGLGHDLGSFGGGFFPDLIFNESCLCDDLIVLEVGVGVNRVNQSFSPGRPFTGDSLGLGLDGLNLFLLFHVDQVGLLDDILSLFALHLSLLFGLLQVILDSLFEGELLPLEGVLELKDGLVLHGTGDFFVQLDAGDDDSLHEDSLARQVLVQILKHALGVVRTSEAVGVSGLDLSGEGPDSLHDVCVDSFINLGDVTRQLLHVFVFRVDFHKD